MAAAVTLTTGAAIIYSNGHYPNEQCGHYFFYFPPGASLKKMMGLSGLGCHAGVVVHRPTGPPTDNRE